MAAFSSSEQEPDAAFTLWRRNRRPRVPSCSDFQSLSSTIEASSAPAVRCLRQLKKSYIACLLWSSNSTSEKSNTSDSLRSGVPPCMTMAYKEGPKTFLHYHTLRRMPDTGRHKASHLPSQRITLVDFPNGSMPPTLARGSISDRTILMNEDLIDCAKTLRPPRYSRSPRGRACQRDSSFPFPPRGPSPKVTLRLAFLAIQIARKW
jgi:hypothetical protein